MIASANRKSQGRDLFAFHRALLKGKIGQKEMARLRRWLCKWLCRALPQTDTRLIGEVVGEVLRSYWKTPERFEAQCRLPLEFYLLYAAARQLSAFLPSARLNLIEELANSR